MQWPLFSGSLLLVPHFWPASSRGQTGTCPSTSSYSVQAPPSTRNSKGWLYQTWTRVSLLKLLNKSKNATFQEQGSWVSQFLVCAAGELIPPMSDNSYLHNLLFCRLGPTKKLRPGITHFMWHNSSPSHIMKNWTDIHWGRWVKWPTQPETKKQCATIAQPSMTVLESRYALSCVLQSRSFLPTRDGQWWLKPFICTPKISYSVAKKTNPALFGFWRCNLFLICSNFRSR